MLISCTNLVGIEKVALCLYLLLMFLIGYSLQDRKSINYRQIYSIKGNLCVLMLLLLLPNDVAACAWYIAKGQWMVFPEACCWSACTGPSPVKAVTRLIFFLYTVFSWWHSDFVGDNRFFLFFYLCYLLLSTECTKHKLYFCPHFLYPLLVFCLWMELTY